MEKMKKIALVIAIIVIAGAIPVFAVTSNNTSTNTNSAPAQTQDHACVNGGNCDHSNCNMNGTCNMNGNCPMKGNCQNCKATT
jgi:hypothetical protein